MPLLAGLAGLVDHAIGLIGGLLVGYLTWRFGIMNLRQMRRAAQRTRA